MPQLNPPKNIITMTFLVLVFLISGCSQFTLPAPSSTPTEKPYLTFTINPSITATHTRVPPTKTKTPIPTSTKEIIPPPQVFQPLPTHKDYILYVDQNPDDYSNEIWAVNPQENKPFLVLKGMGLWPQGWSPSGEKWLFSSEHALYVANKDGSGIQQVYDDPRYIRFDAGWLSDHIILMNAYSDLTLPPDLYQMDLEKTDIEPITIEGSKYIQGVSPENQVYIVSMQDGKIRFVNSDGTISESSSYDYISFPFTFNEIQFVPETTDFIFWGGRDETPGAWFLKGTLDSSNPIMLFETTKIRNIGDRKLSPDGELYGFVYDSKTSSGRIFTVIDVKSAKVMFQLDYPYTFSHSYFTWSPDSSSIVLPYQESDASGVYTIRSGLQIMDIKTGKTTVILKNNIIYAFAWHIND